ncbi:MAG TPA: protein kinase, partial [Nannocystaceae bacterium]|nr:protein kinase [Nannocystaceae bacterium]
MQHLADDVRDHAQAQLGIALAEVREIGRGGMAEVWVARKANSIGGKFVALKMILPQFVGDERYSRMFHSEAEVSAPLSHSNIVQVFDEGEDDGRSYLVMEWVDG